MQPTDLKKTTAGLFSTHFILYINIKQIKNNTMFYEKIAQNQHNIVQTEQSYQLFHKFRLKNAPLFPDVKNPLNTIAD